MDWTILIVAACVVFGMLVLKRISFLSAEKARDLLKQGALVVDVRTAAEFKSRHLPGAVNIPLGDLSNEAPRHLPDKGRGLLLHCLSGARSGVARQRLMALGYMNVHNLGSYGRAQKIVRSRKS